MDQIIVVGCICEDITHLWSCCLDTWAIRPHGGFPPHLSYWTSGHHLPPVHQDFAEDPQGYSDGGHLHLDLTVAP
jgi:hypothetical protein